MFDNEGRSVLLVPMGAVGVVMAANRSARFGGADIYGQRPRRAFGCLRETLFRSLSWVG